MKQLPLLGIELSSLARKLTFICLLTACWWLSLTIVRAQEVSPVPSESPITAPAATDIQIQPSLNTEISELRQRYRAELENYRSLDRQAAIANQQYQQLKTLVSLEAAVTSIQKAMLSRAKVLDLYFTLLRLELTNATGVELTVKQQLLARLDQVLIDLSAHQAKVEQASDREAIDIISQEFLVENEGLENLSYQIQAQVTLSKLQTVYDKAQNTKDEVRDQTASQITALQQPARERAFAETDRNLLQVRSELGELQTSIEKEKGFGRGSYSSFLKKADPIYAGLAQTVSFLSELAGL